MTGDSLPNLAVVSGDRIVVLPGSPLAHLSEDGQTVMVIRGAIEHDTVRSVEAALESISGGKALTLVLSSRGGRAIAAYKIGTLLQAASSHLRVVVPRCARSAATLLALAADSLMLGAAAELGPLDASLAVRPFKDSEVMTWSTASLPYLSRIASDWFDGDAGEMFRALPLDSPTLATLTGLYKAEESVRQLAGRLLAGRRVDSTPDGDAVIQSLLSSYVSHDFPILRDEARSLGLPVIEASEDDDLSLAGVHKQCEALVRLRPDNGHARHELILGGPAGWSFVDDSSEGSQ